MDEFTHGELCNLDQWDAVAKQTPLTGRVVLTSSEYIKLRAAVAAQPEAGEAVAWKLVPVEPDETMEAVGDMNLMCGAADVYRAMLASAPTIQPTQPVQEREALVIDGYEGEKKIRRYINELHRVRFLNQWLADAYCNKLRDIYESDCRATCSSEKDADLRAKNKLADVWRERKNDFAEWWKEGVTKPEDPLFSVEHDALSQRLIAALPAQAGDAGEPSDGERLSGDVAFRASCAWKWGYEYLQSRMESIGRHGWAHDCDGEIEARIEDAIKTDAAIRATKDQP